MKEGIFGAGAGVPDVEAMAETAYDLPVAQFPEVKRQVAGRALVAVGVELAVKFADEERFVLDPDGAESALGDIVGRI